MSLSVFQGSSSSSRQCHWERRWHGTSTITDHLFCLGQLSLTCNCLRHLLVWCILVAWTCETIYTSHRPKDQKYNGLKIMSERWNLWDTLCLCAGQMKTKYTRQPVISGTIESLIAIVVHGVVDCRAIGPINKGGLATCHLETCGYVS